MKKYIAVLIGLICVFSLSLSVMAEELVNYTFDDNKAVNTVTNTLTSGGAAKYADGYEGKSLSLDDSYGLLLGDVGDVFSVSAMVKITSTGGTDTIFFKNMGTSSDQKWTGVLSNAGKPSFWTHGDGYRWSIVASGNEVVLDSWAHVVYVENSGVGSLYVNDKLIGTGNVARGAGQLYLGVTYWSADAVSGLIDNIKLYDTDITNKTIDVPSEVIGDIDLPTTMGTESIIWETSDENIITADGKVTRGDTDATAILTAYVNGEAVGEFEVTVLKKPVIVNEEVLLSYKFDENDGAIIHDVSGNGNHAAAFGNLVVEEDGAAFDGLDDYVKMPEGVVYGHDDITIVMTMRPDSAQKFGFAYGFGNTSDTGYMFLNTSTPDTNLIRFAATKTTYTGETGIASLPGIRAGEWATVVVVISGQDAYMYIDGDLVMDGSIGMKVSDLGRTTQNYIGKSLYSADPYFAGVVSEFTVYDYCMSAANIKNAYKKDVEYAPAKEVEEYITSVSFDDGIDVEFDTFGREDVKIGAIVLDENNDVIEFDVVTSSDELNLTKSGTVCVFAFNEKDNLPGSVYVKGKGDGFGFEYTPGKIEIISETSHNNGMVIIAGYDIAGTLTGVAFKVCDVQKGTPLELNGDFDNAVNFKMLYWGDMASMTPVD